MFSGGKLERVGKGSLILYWVYRGGKGSLILYWVYRGGKGSLILYRVYRGEGSSDGSGGL